MESTQKFRFGEFLKNSALARVLLVGGLVLLLLIPTRMIDLVISEREQRRDSATDEVQQKWGREQKVLGPFVRVPYVAAVSTAASSGRPQTRTRTRYAVFLPKDLRITGTVHSEVRYRGIFEVPVYRMSLLFKGSFERPDLSEWSIPEEDIRWDQAHLALWISDPRAITNQTKLTWNEAEVAFQPGSGISCDKASGIHAGLKNKLSGNELPFSFVLEMNGSKGAHFVPFGGRTEVELKSNWVDPSFQGAWLPFRRTVGPDGFDAAWSIGSLGRDFPQKRKSSAGFRPHSFESSQFGVDLMTPVDHYRMAERSVKYSALFLALTFTTLWLFEILARIRVHPVQYLLVGAGMCLFYLLELSLAEHIGLALAYLIASSSVLALISMYCIAVLRSVKRACVVGLVLSLLYGYLYVLLMNQDYALLVGSVGLFVVLAIVMYLTRRIDWDSLYTRQPATTEG